MGLRQVLVVGAVALDQIGNGVEAQAVDAGIEPEMQQALDLLHDARIVEVEVGLVGIEAVPEEGIGDRVPRPVRLLGIDEDDARAAVALVGVAPDVIVAGSRAGLGAPRARWNQAMLVGGVVDDQLDDDADAPLVRLG